jgi:hypothetical protein
MNCKCGRPAHPNYGSRCEDCFADCAAHLYGRADRTAIVETAVEDVPMYEPFERKKLSRDKVAGSALDNGK